MTINLINPGWIERTVRFLIGLPTATAYFYVRHFSMDWAYAYLGFGLVILITGLLGQDPEALQQHALEKTGTDVPWANTAHAA